MARKFQLKKTGKLQFWILQNRSNKVTVFGFVQPSEVVESDNCSKFVTFEKSEYQDFIEMLDQLQEKDKRQELGFFSSEKEMKNYMHQNPESAPVSFNGNIIRK